MALDRAGLIEQLERLGAESDAVALEAARAAHRKALESGMNWDELLRNAAAAPDRDVDDAPVAETAVAESSAVPDPDAAEVGRLIDRILRKGVSDTLREDLTEMRRELNGGTLDSQDARYIRSLARRLGA